jgi:hypothetical protein
MIVDFPELSPSSWKFLNKKEADFVAARIEVDRHDLKLESFSLGAYIKCGLDTKVWLFSALYMFTTTNTYAIAYCTYISLVSFPYKFCSGERFHGNSWKEVEVMRKEWK